MRIVILQSEAQIKHYSEQKRQTNDIIIPIGPVAMLYAENHGWNICYLGELWSLEEYDQAKDASQAKIDGLIEALNTYALSWKPTLGLEIGNYYAFQIYELVGHLHYNYFIICSIVSRFQPDNVLIYTKDNAVQMSSGLLPDPDCILAEVALSSGCFKTDSIEIQRVSERRKANSAKENVLNVLPDRLLMQLRYVRSRWRIRGSKASEYQLLLLGGQYDWIKISRYTAFNSIFGLHVTLPLAGTKAGVPPQRLVDILKGSVECANGFLYDMESTASAIYADMILYAKRYEEIKNKLQQYDAIVTAVLTSPSDNYMAHVASKHNIPVVVWQHGEKGQTQDVTTLYTELFYATDFFAYAKIVSDQYRLWINKYQLLNVETVGSLGKRVAWLGGDSIVYATGKWFGTSVPFTPLPDPDSRLYRAHKTILGYLNTIAPTHSVIFKANNTPGANEVPYNYSHIHMDYSTPFAELLKTAGVIILDTPGTTLVEACSTNVPIFVLGGRARYLPDFLDKVKRRVVWCDTPDELVTKLEAYFSKGTYDADVHDDSYLRGYSVAIESDEVVLRVKDCLMKAIDRSRNAGEQWPVSKTVGEESNTLCEKTEGL